MSEGCLIAVAIVGWALAVVCFVWKLFAGVDYGLAEERCKRLDANNDELRAQVGTMRNEFWLALKNIQPDEKKK